MRKRCTKCRTLKAHTAFARDRQASDGLQSYCRTCKSEHSTRAKYGVSPEERAELEDKYGGRCWLCLDLFDHTNRDKLSCVDHDHHTGAVRGMLCAACNRAIGKLGDDLEGVCRALVYLYQGVGDDALADTITTEYGIKYNAVD